MARVQRQEVQGRRARAGVPVGHLFDRIDVADGVAHAQAGHPVRLRERARDDDARVVDGDRNVRVVIGIGDVVEICLVHQNRRVGRLAVDLRDELARGFGADIGRRRVVRIAVEHEARAVAAAAILSRSIRNSESSETPRTGCPIISA